jgi:hypothetical protein
VYSDLLSAGTTSKTFFLIQTNQRSNNKTLRPDEQNERRSSEQLVGNETSINSSVKQNEKHEARRAKQKTPKIQQIGTVHAAKRDATTSMFMRVNAV